jgi:archaellum biogenesis ATPase FlaH
LFEDAYTNYIQEQRNILDQTIVSDGITQEFSLNFSEQELAHIEADKIIEIEELHRLAEESRQRRMKVMEEHNRYIEMVVIIDSLHIFPHYCSITL